MLYIYGQEVPRQGMHQSPASALFWRLAARVGNMASAFFRKWLLRLPASASGRPCTPAPALPEKTSSVLLIDTRSALEVCIILWKMQASFHMKRHSLKAQQTHHRIVFLAELSIS